jgi:hypothetical protein
MRTTIELSDRTHTLLRARAAERGMRGFSRIVEEAIVRFFERGTDDEVVPALAEAEGAWSDEDVAEWEMARQPGATPTGLAAIAGALSEWGELEDVVAEIYAARHESEDRPAPDLG